MPDDCRSHEGHAPTTEKEKMLAGEPYLALDPELAADHARAQRLLHTYNHAEPDEEREMFELQARLLYSWKEARAT